MSCLRVNSLKIMAGADRLRFPSKVGSYRWLVASAGVSALS